MKALGPASFEQRLRRSAIWVSVIGVGTATLLVVAATAADLARQTVGLVRSRTDLLALNCSAALAFDDREHAATVLGTLRVIPEFAQAVLVDRDGRPFARFDRPLEPFGGTWRGDGFERRGRWLLFGMPVVDRGEHLGELRVVYDLRNTGRRLLKILLLALAGGGVALVLARAAARRLTNTLTGPIESLVATAQRVAERGDYGARAEVRGDDELGRFATVFNEMLQHIEDQRADLERSARERTALLEGERAARSEAERASRMKDEFLATLSHELRTPLMPIVGWLELLRLPDLGDEERAKGLAVIERNARLQARMIDDLLDMSRIISGKLRIDPVRLELGPVLDAAIATLRPAAAAKDMTIVEEREPAPVEVVGDASRLQQVFWNLLSNAVKFTPRGGTVTVRLRRAGADVVVEVADTGQGIEAEFLPYVFDRFRQADGSITRRHGGLGLGLSIVRQLVDFHGGDVAAWSAGPGAGATFRVSLPLAPVEAGGAPGAAGERTVVLSDRPLAGTTVLAVDDEADARDLLERLLGEAGARVVVAASAAEAYAALVRERPDLLVCDIGMADGDGYELLRRVRELPAGRGGEVPALALTAFAREEDRARALAAGYARHVAKPVEAGVLVAVAAKLLRRA